MANPIPHLTPRMRGPQGRIQFRIGGGPHEPQRFLVDFDGEPVDLSRATIQVTARLRDPSGRSTTIGPEQWKLKARSVHEVIATWHPTGTEVVALGDYMLKVDMTVNGNAYDGGEFNLACRENVK